MAEPTTRIGSVGRRQHRRVRGAPALLAIPAVDARLERRNGGRVQSTGTAVIHGAIAARGRILDLSLGGMRLLVRDAFALPELGTRVCVDARLDGAGRWLRLIGAVARVDTCGSGATLVIELVAVPPDFEDLVQDELLSELECTHVPQVLLVDSARGRRELVGDAFRAIGYHVIDVSSPLEAIAMIDQSRLHLSAVVIASTKLASHAGDLRRFLRETYPEVPLIDIDERACKPRETYLGSEAAPAWQLGDVASQLGDPL